MIRAFLFSSLIFGSIPMWATTPSCDAILNPSSATSAKDSVVADLTNRFLTNNDLSNIPAVIAGSAGPTWQAYQWILEAKRAIREHQLTLKDFEPLRLEILKSIKQFIDQPEKQKLVDKNYRFFEQLQVINQLLGGELFPNLQMQFAEKDEDLILKAEKIVLNNEKRFRKVYPTSNYRNTVELVDRIEKYSSKGEELLKLIDEGLILTIRRPEGGRFLVPLTGFQNQRVTGNSKGMYNPNYRNQVESLLTGIPKEEYDGFSTRLQPQYGEIRPDSRVKNMQFYSSATGYGPDLWIIKRDVVTKRVTWTPTDSFSVPMPAIGSEPATWPQMFIPWSHREMIAPYVIRAIDENNFSISSPPGDFNIQNAAGGYYYFEAQIWGPVTIQDVEAFVFTRNPPDETFINELKSHGIQIYDGRNIPFVPYEVTK